MRTILILLCALLLIGCSTERRCARAAKKCAPVWQTQKPDTTFIERTITIDSSRVDTVIHCDELPVDTPVVIQKEKDKAKLTLRRKKDGKLKIDCDCPQQDTVIQEHFIKGPPVPIVKRPAWLPLAGVIVFLLGMIAGYKIFGDNRKTK